MQIHIRDLWKTYKRSAHALRGVNLTVNAGMFGLLGPNGAGKTTLLRILATLLQPSSGQIKVDGCDIADRRHQLLVKRTLGYLPQELGMYADLSVYEFMDYMATLKQWFDRRERATQIVHALEQVALLDLRQRKIKHLSGGMKRRVGIAQAILGNPRLLIVDEPTVGLDPAERVRFRMLLSELAVNRTVILSTHIVEDIATTCHDIAVLDLGEVRFQGSVAELIQRANAAVWEVMLDPGTPPHPGWRIASQVREGDRLRLRIVGPQPSADARACVPTLEEAYLVLMAADGEA